MKKVTLRISDDLYEEIVVEARNDERSINAWIERALRLRMLLPEKAFFQPAKGQSAVNVPPRLDAYGPLPGGVGKITEPTVPTTKPKSEGKSGWGKSEKLVPRKP